MNTIATITLGHTIRGLLLLLLVALICVIIIMASGCRVLFRPESDGAIQVPARPHLCTVEPAGFYSWGFIARNGVTVHKSNVDHTSKEGVIAHYAAVRNNMVQKGSPDRIVRLPEDGGGFRWILNEGLARSKDITDPDASMRLEMSDQPFASANAARENYADLREAVLNCPPQDLDESLLP